MPPKGRSAASYGSSGTGRGGATRNMTKAQAAAQDMGLNDMLTFLSDKLTRQAVEPNMLAYKPHKKQVLFHKSQARGRLLLGGNRGGKTVAGVIESLRTVSHQNPNRQLPDRPIRGRIIGDGFDNGTVNQVLLPAVKRWIVPSMLINGSWEDSYAVGERRLTLADESFIEFKSYDQDPQKHAGSSLDFVHFDEEPPQAIYAENMLRIVDTGGFWYMTLTPLNGMNWVYDEIYMPAITGNLPGIDVFEMASTDNPFIDESILDALLAGLSPEERQQRKLGQFAERGGLIFPDFGESHLYKFGESLPPNWEPPPNWRIYMSLDHGLNNPTAALWHAVSPESEIITFGEHYERNMLVKDHVRHIKAFEALHGIDPWMRVGDPAMKQRNAVTGTSIVQEYALHGIHINVEDIPRDVKTGIDKMRTYLTISPKTLKPHWHVIADRCPNLIRELKRLHWRIYGSAKQNDRSNKMEEVHKKDDHAFDSTRYFFTVMPNLSPDQVWHFKVSDITPNKSYFDTLAEMSHYSSERAWVPSRSHGELDRGRSHLMPTQQSAYEPHWDGSFGFDAPGASQGALGWPYSDDSVQGGTDASSWTRTSSGFADNEYDYSNYEGY